MEKLKSIIKSYIKEEHQFCKKSQPYASSLILLARVKALLIELKVREKRKLLPSDIYFNIKDENLLYKIKSDILKQIWDNIVDKIENKNAYGFKGDICPFCILDDMQGKLIKSNFYKIEFNTNCEFCQYAEEHGYCMEEGSDFDIIQKHFKDEEELNNVLPNGILRFTINEIRKYFKYEEN